MCWSLPLSTISDQEPSLRKQIRVTIITKNTEKLKDVSNTVECGLLASLISLLLNQCRVLQFLNIVLAGLHAKLKGKHGDGYEKKSCAVCSGLDMVQIHLLNIIFKDEGTAEVSKTLVKQVKQVYNDQPLGMMA